MKPVPDFRAFDLSLPDDRVPHSEAARKLRALREALLYKRLLRPSWRAGDVPFSQVTRRDLILPADRAHSSDSRTT